MKGMTADCAAAEGEGLHKGVLLILLATFS